MLVLQDRFGNNIEKGSLVSYATGGSDSSMEVGLVEDVYIKKDWRQPYDKWRVLIKKLNATSKLNYKDREWSARTHQDIMLFTTLTTLKKITNIIVLPIEYLKRNEEAYKLLTSPKGSITQLMIYHKEFTDTEYGKLCLDQRVYEMEIVDAPVVPPRIVEC